MKEQLMHRIKRLIYMVLPEPFRSYPPRAERHEWIARWDRLRFKIWIKFSRMPISEESVKWLERQSARLCKLKPPWNK